MDGFVAIDFETANSITGSACAVALVKCDGSGHEIDRYATLLRPHSSLRHFDQLNISIHGITPPDVVDAPSWRDIYGEVCSFAGDLPLVAHNMSFDGRVLRQLAELYQLADLPNQRLCTVKLARKILPDLPSRSLNKVFDYYFPGEYFQHHEAEADARACARIFTRMLNEFDEDTILAWA